MPMDSVSEENVEKLLTENKEKQDELERIKSTTIEQMWLSELEILDNEYQTYQKEREQSQIGEIKKKKTITKVAGGTKKVIKKIMNIDLGITVYLPAMRLQRILKLHLQLLTSTVVTDHQEQGQLQKQWHLHT
jgi:hypothetical protein